EACCRFLAAKTERETERYRKCHNDTSEERLEERRHAELIESRKDREHPDRQLRDSAGKASRRDTRRARGADDDALRNLCDNCRDDDDKHRDDDAREERQEAELAEEGHLR